MKLELLSDNLIIILQQIMNQQNLCKLINYNESTPLSQANLTLPVSSLLFTKLFPYPFDDETILEDCVQIRVWCPGGEFSNGGNININDVFIDLIIAKDLFLININGKPKLRPYEIMKELIQTFEDKNISTLGKLHFKRYKYYNINKQFACFSLWTDMMLVGK